MSLSCTSAGPDPPTGALGLELEVNMDAKLIMFREDGRRRDFALVPGVTTIGRKNDCSIRIPLNVVSRRHAEIVVGESEVVIRDLGAANGTYVNAKKIDKASLSPGDKVMIGPVMFTIQIDGKPDDDALRTIRSDLSNDKRRGSGTVSASKHVYMSADEIDPISALEALASSADQTVIEPDEDDDIFERDK